MSLTYIPFPVPAWPGHGRIPVTLPDRAAFAGLAVSRAPLSGAVSTVSAIFAQVKEFNGPPRLGELCTTSLYESLIVDDDERAMCLGAWEDSGTWRTTWLIERIS